MFLFFIFIDLGDHFIWRKPTFPPQVRITQNLESWLLNFSSLLCYWFSVTLSKPLNFDKLPQIWSLVKCLNVHFWKSGPICWCWEVDTQALSSFKHVPPNIYLPSSSRWLRVRVCVVWMDYCSDLRELYLVNKAANSAARDCVIGVGGMEKHDSLPMLKIISLSRNLFTWDLL